MTITVQSDSAFVVTSEGKDEPTGNGPEGTPSEWETTGEVPIEIDGVNVRLVTD